MLAALLFLPNESLLQLYFFICEIRLSAIESLIVNHPLNQKKKKIVISYGLTQ